MPKPPATPEKYRIWIEVRRRYHLSDMHIQMARELSLNPKKFGSWANEWWEFWEMPPSKVIERLYMRRFGRKYPDFVKSIEQLIEEHKTAQRQSRESQ